jgi:hypothetical protein
MEGLQDPLFQSGQKMRLYFSKGQGHALRGLGINHRCFRLEVLSGAKNLHVKKSLYRKRSGSRDVTTVQAELRDLRSYAGGG